MHTRHFGHMLRWKVKTMVGRSTRRCHTLSVVLSASRCAKSERLNSFLQGLSELEHRHQRLASIMFFKKPRLPEGPWRAYVCWYVPLISIVFHIGGRFRRSLFTIGMAGTAHLSKDGGLARPCRGRVVFRFLFWRRGRGVKLDSCYAFTGSGWQRGACHGAKKYDHYDLCKVTKV